MIDSYSVASPGAKNDFATLRRMAVEQGLYRRQPVYYTWKAFQVAAMLAAGIAVLVLTDNIWLHILDAVYLAFVFGQFGLLFHDAGHRQIFANSKWDNVIGYACAFTLGASLQSWMSVHNAHHAHPNHEDSDPDIDMPFFAFSEQQARDAVRRNFLLRFIVRNQAVLYFPLLCFTMFSMRTTSWTFLIQNRSKILRYSPDWAACALHLVVYLGFLFWFLPWVNAIVFIVVHSLLWGFYMGSIFAPNHKGMPIIPAESKIDYLHEQIITSRNVRSAPWTDFLYGGLNYQVEHHLFPTMPRNKLKKANVLVQRFCKENSIPYHETGVIRSYVEIVGHMGEIARYFRGLQGSATA